MQSHILIVNGSWDMPGQILANFKHFSHLLQHHAASQLHICSVVSRGILLPLHQLAGKFMSILEMSSTVFNGVMEDMPDNP